jgi:hypothetical protein
VGKLYIYAGVAPRRWNGQFKGDALKPGEYIVRPGLVYRLKKRSKHPTATDSQPAS